jgi:hypothetical protein
MKSIAFGFAVFFGVLSVGARANSNWTDFQSRAEAVLLVLPSTPINAEDGKAYMQKLADVSETLPSDQQSVLRDTVHWLGYCYGMAAARKNPEVGKEKAASLGLALMFKHFNGKSPKDIVVHAIQMKEKYPKLWKLHVDTY